jgi:hypothetical protein
MRTCADCGGTYRHTLVAPGDLERSFDFAVEWRGIRLLCPHCLSVQRTSFAPVRLTNDRPAGWPESRHVYAVIGPGAEIVPFPGARGRAG